MKRENIYKASELDSRVLQIDQELTTLNYCSEIVLQKKLLPELFEEVRVKKIEVLKQLKEQYLKDIEQLA